MHTTFPLKRLQQTATPAYYYDLNLLDRTLEAVKKAAPEENWLVHYAIKSNPNPVIVKRIADAGLGADCVSGGEIRLALESGIPAAKIVYSGVGKTDAELTLALSEEIGCINVESIEELQVIAELAASLGKRAEVALRVNPDIDAHTHHYITTGLKENKFGISMLALDKAADICLSSDWLSLKGLHFHIGSQILVTEPFRILCERIASLEARLSARGVELKSINVGGGLGIDYDDPDANPIPDFNSYFATFRDYLPLGPQQELHFELGRSLTAQCGSLIARVLFVKQGIDKQFVILDAGMTDLIRPALYQVHHKIENLSAAARGENDADATRYDVVGPVCESSDSFGNDVLLPLTRRGDIIAIRSAGAYGEAMASTYNCRPLAPSIYYPEG